MLASSDTGGKKRENHVVPSNIVKGNELQLKETPLCTLIVSFTDDEANDVTSAHVFTMSTPQLYPQTRKTVYKKGSSSEMSLTSTPFSTDDERYTNSAMSPPLQKQLIQEVSLSYSAPYTSTVKPLRHDLPLAFSPFSFESEYEKTGDFHSHTRSSDSRLSKHSKLHISKKDSVERLLNNGRKETEFSAISDTTPYFSAQSATKAARVTPSHTPRDTPRDTPVSFDRRSTNRVDSPLSNYNLIVSESTTFEELTTITTSKNQTTRKKEVTTEMPTVNALTKQFEISSHQERVVPVRPRKNSNTPKSVNGSAKSLPRVVVINKSQKNCASNRPSVVYSPGGILTTTIVDIEPASFGRRTEEYKISEEYIVKRYDNATRNFQGLEREFQKQQATEYRAYQGNKETYKHRDQEKTQRSYSAAETGHYNESPVDTSSIDEVKNVIDRWETKFGGTATRANEKQLRSVSRVDMNDNISRVSQDKIIVHQRSESQPVERIIPISPIPPSQKPTKTTETENGGVLHTYDELKTVYLKQTVDMGSVSAKPAPTPKPITSPVMKETIVSPPPIPTPSPTIDVAEELLRPDGILTTQRTEFAQYSTTVTKETKQEEESNYVTDNNKVAAEKEEKVVVIEEKEDEEKKLKPQTPTPSPVPGRTESVAVETRSDEYLHNFLDRDYRIKRYEEWSTTKRMRDRSQPPERPLTSYSSYSDRSRSIDRSYERQRMESGMSRTYSEGRGLASGAYTSGFGGLVSGMSSAGAICTTQIRDAREREKREIGLLNDRLADYIEKVRFLEAQNQCLSHDIDILRRGFSGGGHVSGLYDTEIAQAKRILEQTIAGHAAFDRDIAALGSDIDAIRKKWIDAVNAVKAHREDHDVDLDRLAKVEAEISLFKRKIRIVEEDVIRIRRENDGIYNEIARIKQLTHNEIALKNERSLNVQDLLQRIKLLQTENSTRIEQELVFIRRDTTAENRDYFRHELQAAIRDIRADYEAISIRNRNDIEVWYREQIRKIQTESKPVNQDLYKEELASIRTTVTNVKSRLAEVEGRNFFLEKLIEDLRNNEESKLYEISLAEKDAQIARLREQCTELSIQMERLCDNEISLRAEIERYRVLLNGANVTTYVSNTHPSGVSVGGIVGTTRVISQTTRTNSSSNTSYSGVPASRTGYSVGGNIGGISVGGTIGGVSVGGNVGAHGASGHVSGGAAGSVSSLVSEKRPDRVHDEKGVDASGRSFHSWYLGTISINQITPSYIELKNICKIRRVDVGGFRVEQYINGELLGSAQINVPLILDPQEVVRIHHRHGKYLGQFFMDVDAFDNSTASRTSMYNYTEPNEERAWFVYLN
ncbi:hypothetical protein L3Y34_010205 [Caenorhabditis briggsae]|uniref:Uncharacterized protein n=1 Tax=Caenorhabditis briggsae TaxID=6238 RepID=A0AAE8ZPC3_CAEBR|nr:hypothetical protein L3Y34_010205 [Caenorhabditis briggsae]